MYQRHWRKLRSCPLGNADIYRKTVKKLLLTSSVVALLLGTNIVFSQAPADEHAGHHPPGDTTPATPPESRPSTQAVGPAGMPQMQDKMKTMQELMLKVRASKDPAERQQLLQQHSKAMQDQMGMMRGMGGQGGMMGGGMRMGGGMQGGTSPPANAQQTMQAHMEMMQMMMDQMQQHLEAQQDATPVK
jgi:hypothetical protein